MTMMAVTAVSKLPVKIRASLNAWTDHVLQQLKTVRHVQLEQ
jgi:hypothetical protein